jgi:hypothetical protein
VPVDLQVPVGVGGERVVPVPVEDHRHVVADPLRAEDALEGLAVDQVALARILEVVLPVQLDRARDVALGVETLVLVDLDHDEPRPAEVLREPAGRDEHGLRKAVSLHFRSFRGRSQEGRRAP